MVLIYHAQIAMSKGAKNLEIIIPAEGVPVSWSHICIAKDAPNLEWAQKFLDFTLSKEAQLAWRDKFFTGSARDDMPPPPPGAIAVDKVKRLASTSADLQEYFEKNAEISDEWTDLFKS
jgi:ABC-type Fe3+ transport system substrate-binding protein